MRISRFILFMLCLALLSAFVVPVRADDEEEDFYKALREKQRREKAIKEGKDPDAPVEAPKEAVPEPPKLPDTASGWISVIKRAWDSDKADEQKLVEDAVAKLKEAIGSDATLRTKVSKNFEGFKEREGAKLAAGALKDVKATREMLRKVLTDNRGPALKAIMNPKYTESDGCKLQPEVDKALKPLFDVWNSPVAYLILQKKADIAAPAAKLERLAKLLGQIDEGLGKWEAGIESGDQFIRKAAADLIDIKKEEYDANKGVLAGNEAIADGDCDAESKEHVRVLNDYRMMLGKGCLAINLALYKAATGHSKYQEKLGRIGHDIPGHPDGQTPAARCKRAGYGGSVGENVLMGAKTPADAVWQWYNAAEHHRSMIGGWVHIGAGHSGIYWTQNFGGGKGN